MYVVGEAEFLENDLVGAEHRNKSGEVCALVTIVTDLKGVLLFEAAGGVMERVSMPGEDKLFLSPGERIITVRMSGYEPLRIILQDHGIPRLESGRVWKLRITGKKLTTGIGTLTLTTEPPGAKITVVGLGEENRSTPYPFKNTIAGVYSLKLEKARYVTADTTMMIEEGRTDSLHIVLTPAFGNLKVLSDPPRGEVYIDNKARGFTTFELSGEANGLDVGSHTVTVNHPYPHKNSYIPHTETVQIKSGEMTTVNAKFTPRFGFLSIISNISGTKFKVTDIETKKVVYDSLGNPNRQVLTGQYLIEAAVPDSGYIAITLPTVDILEGAARPVTVEFTKEHRKAFIELQKRKRGTRTRSIVLSGWGQIFAGYKQKGMLIAGLQAVTVAGAVRAANMFMSSWKDYTAAQTAYRSAMNLDDIERTALDAKSKHDTASSLLTLRNAAVSAAIGVYVWNVVDAVRTTPKVPGESRVSALDIAPAVGPGSVGIRVSARF
jgi:hypothetical protein